jgi:Arc/MetJ-type ribon-helix-helix transcriptional regulator
MSLNQQISVTLPDELAELVRRKVSSGEYANEADVILDGLSLIGERDSELERWLREDVVAACDAFDANPSSGISVDELLTRLKEKRESPQSA